MKRRNKLLIAIIIVILIGVVAIIGQIFYLGNNTTLDEGNRTILVCAIDESEVRPGMGACDMAFLVYLDNGSLVNYTAIYPGGMTHPTEAEPAEGQALGAGSKLLLHDSFWEKDNKRSMELAKEIVQHNMNMTQPIDAVVAINTQALDAILSSAGTVTVNGEKVNVSGIDIIREDQYGNGESRGDAVLELVKAIAKSADNPNVKAKMVQAAIDQYSKGNIVMEPAGDFVGLLASKGFSNLFG
ncbi:MAG: DUF4012 domain-containing protein [Methanobrevibacter sp.]|uniref:DUF4012 domain-containing protein n=1 Tax=Methanobrevibacter sp. TaxID=66852 RepID=UPI0026E0CFE4|nr:DUF4012 domain-containing protein [Methanobrevibacter sp.]MDO5848413.1 DUF4012 domain-containing protein [Methanobrevibacter sp.]